MLPIIIIVSAFVLGLLGYLFIIRGKKTPFLTDPQQWKNFTLIKRTQVTHNSVIFRFSLSSPNQILGLPVGKHIVLRYQNTNDPYPISRQYTPISSNYNKGYVDLLIKIYDQGKMSQYLNKLSIGGSIDVRGPLGSLHYIGSNDLSNRFSIKNKKGIESIKSYNHIGMIAGGTGITPHYQIIQELIRQKKNHNNARLPFKLSLIFGNVSMDDILLKNELIEAEQILGKDQFHLEFIIDKKSTDDNREWKYSTGYITAEMIKNHLPPPKDDTLILLCGPKVMCDIMEKHLKALDFREDQYFMF